MFSVLAVMLGLVVLMVVASIYLIIRVFSVPAYYKTTIPADIDGPEVIIVGSGVLGSTMAAVLARDGRRVTVIERSLSKPDRVQGEIMLAYGVSLLKQLGLADCLENIGAIPGLGLHLVDTESEKELEILYKDYQRGCHFIHGNFVPSLRRAAQAEKRCKYIEGSVIALIEEDGIVKGIHFKTHGTEDMQELRVPLTVVADGAFSRLRRVNIQQKPIHTSIVLNLEHKGPFGKDGLMHVYMIKSKTIIFYPITKDCWRVILDIKGATPKNLKEALRNSRSALPDDIREIYMDAVKNRPLRTCHTFTFPMRAIFKPGVLTLGDALNMRHPLTASGMSLAFRDVYLWRNYLHKIPNLEDVKAMYKAHRFFLITRQIPALVCNVNTNLMYQLVKSKEDIECYLRSKFIDFLVGSQYWRRLSMDMNVLVDSNPLHLIWFSLGISLYLGKCVVLLEPWYLFLKGLLNGGMLVAVMLWDTISQIWNELKEIMV